MIKRISLAIVAALLVVALSAPVALAAPLPDNCTKKQGTVTCSTFEGPGNNQGGVGTTETTETQGNTTNKSPEDQQGLEDECTKKPPKSQGGAIGDCPPA